MVTGLCDLKSVLLDVIQCISDESAEAGNIVW